MPVVEALPFGGKGHKSPRSTSLALFRSRLRKGCAFSLRLFRSLCRTCLKVAKRRDRRRRATSFAGLDRKAPQSDRTNGRAHAKTWARSRKKKTIRASRIKRRASAVCSKVTPFQKTEPKFGGACIRPRFFHPIWLYFREVISARTAWVDLVGR